MPTPIPSLLKEMTLAEKIGQMTQVEKNSIRPEDVTRYGIGSVLSGGGGAPEPNSPEAWAQMVDGFQRAALSSRLGIPLLYGVDAVHGHNNLQGATLFPHNISLGASGDADLVQRIGRATAEALVATGVRWNFAPMVAVPQDLRWGRAYECYSDDPERVADLGAATMRGLQGQDLSDPLSVLATPKHFIGDGGTRFGSSTSRIGDHSFLLDQGDTVMEEAELRRRFLPPYRAAIAAGTRSIMVTHSQWNGTRVLASRHLLTEVLKGELGFSGFLVSDWQSVELIDNDYSRALVTAVNAGVDLVMVPFDYRRFIATLTQAVEQGAVPMGRIDDAVRRILRVKRQLGLFERPFSDSSHRPLADTPEHRALAREAVRKSLVLLKNDRGTLPLRMETAHILVGGVAADDIGRQCGGWSIDWQGQTGAITHGTTLLQGIRAAAHGQVEYHPQGAFGGQDGQAEVGIAVVGETPYAEGLGDVARLDLSDVDRALIQRLRPEVQRLVVILISGRPLAITDLLPQIDALVATWLPGTEGAGVADLLFGDQPFSATLPVAWPATADPTGQDRPLFARGFSAAAR